MVIHYSPCSATAEWEGSLLALYREVGDTWNPTPGHKGYEREALVAKRMEEVSITITLSHHHTIITIMSRCHTIIVHHRTHTITLSIP